ncbi:hypothetical protein QYF36_023244 [Acer negundo]|nr:hypothetical protein QYF36_023244 [Acer negundo]
MYSPDKRPFVLEGNDGYLVKLRPFVRTFLKEASSMFQIYVCSMGKRQYVKKVVEFLDPEGNYFDARLIACEDFNGKQKKRTSILFLDKSVALLSLMTRKVYGVITWTI